MVAWDAFRRTRTAGTNATLIEAVERAFHTTNHSDQVIADNITAQGISTTRVLRYAITTIKKHGRCPFFRSDRGKEVLLLTDAQFSLYILHKKSTGVADASEDTLRFRDCYIFGTSTVNIRIESTWMRIINSRTRLWLVRLIYL
jgi:hypothetical protein